MILPVVGLLLLLGLFWYWASTLIGDDSDNANDLTPTTQAVIIDDTSTATATSTVAASITATETTNQPAGETATESSGNTNQQADETPTEEATQSSGETTSASDTFSDGDSVVTTEGDINFRSSPDSADDTNIIGTLDVGTELTITGPAVEGDDGNIWWPVNDPANDTDGYVVEQYLEASS